MFEAGNGRVLKHVKAGKGVPLQILERVVMQQQLQPVLLMLPLSEKTTSFCRSMLGYKRLVSFVHSDELACCALASLSGISLHKSKLSCIIFLVVVQQQPLNISDLHFKALFITT